MNQVVVPSIRSLAALLFVLLGAANLASAQEHCMAYAPQQTYFTCANDDGCDSSAWITRCPGPNFEVRTNRCSCWAYTFSCCGLLYETYLMDPCDMSCAGDCKPGKSLFAANVLPGFRQTRTAHPTLFTPGQNPALEAASPSRLVIAPFEPVLFRTPVRRVMPYPSLLEGVELAPARIPSPPAR
jgi:hypothetical protein